MSKPKRIYWDACTWIAYINKEVAVPLKDGAVENRFSMCITILEKATAGKLEIVTSAFTLAEVYQRKSTDQLGLSRFPAFLQQPYVLTVPVDMAVGQKAHTMLEAGLISLRPPDAIHFSSALRASCLELHTFDERILQHNNRIPVSGTDMLRVCKPGEVDETGTLFEDPDDNRK